MSEYKKIDASQHNILVVDDEIELAEIIKDDLELEGFKVQVAHSGNQAFEIAQRQSSLDLILSDIRMPGGDGIELLEKIKTRDPNRPELILLTGFSEIPLERAYDLGAVAVFEKPVSFESLLGVVYDTLAPKEDRFKRSHERVEAQIRVILKMNSFQEARESQTVNIGRGGIFIQLDERLPQLGENIDFSLNFQMEKKMIIKGSGVVKWVRHTMDERGPAGVGLEFTKLLDDSQYYLLKVLNAIRTRSYIPSS